MEKTVETLCNKPWRQIEMRSNNNRNVKKEIPAGTVTLYGEGGGEEEITRICGTRRQGLLRDVCFANVTPAAHQSLCRQVCSGQPCSRAPQSKLSGQVKQERAQGGCLGTESRRKT